MDSKKIAAKELALKLRHKAELLDSFDEGQLVELEKRVKAQNGAHDSGCTFCSPCIVVECFVNSPA